MSPHLAGRYSYTRTFLSAAILVAGLIDPVLSQAQDISALPYGPGVTSLTIEDDRRIVL